MIQHEGLTQLSGCSKTECAVPSRFSLYGRHYLAMIISPDSLEVAKPPKRSPSGTAVDLLQEPANGKMFLKMTEMLASYIEWLNSIDQVSKMGIGERNTTDLFGVPDEGMRMGW